MIDYIVHMSTDDGTIARWTTAANVLGVFTNVRQHHPDATVITIREAQTDRYVYGEEPQRDPRVRLLTPYEVSLLRQQEVIE